MTSVQNIGYNQYKIQVKENVNVGKQQTNKKVKFIGKETYINANTGELQEMQVTSVEERDFNFHKVWMKSFIATLDIVGNQKTKLCFWIIDNLNKENQLCYTYRQIADKTGISLDTVRITMRILLDADFLRKRNQGVYIVNPDIIFKGTRNGRMNILTQYNEAEHIKLSQGEKIENIKHSIEILQKELDKLMNETYSQVDQVS